MGTSSDASLPLVGKIVSATATTIQGKSFQTLNNGKAATLEVTMPAHAASGYFGGLVINSFRRDPMGGTPAGEDYGHSWRVGVHSP